jgi:hypothetical protein
MDEKQEKEAFQEGGEGDSDFCRMRGTQND